ncbi:Inositol-1 [Gurleya vavrai]
MSQIKEIFSALYNYFREIDSIIIAGDFNFRGYKNEDVHDFPNDQGTMFLNKYVNFKEPRIVHNATYKYEIGSDQYDDSRNKSWCDRIFVGSKFGVNIMDYGILDINISDHKPVMANIDINTLIEALDDDIVDTVESRAVLAKYVITSFYCFFLENLWLMIFTGLMIIFYHLVKRINNQKS